MTIDDKPIEDKTKQRKARNAAICAYYAAGHKLNECATKFKLGRQRILQILQAGGVWQPYERTDRTKFLGVNISEQTKDKLRQKADKQGISVSRLASDALDDVVKEEGR